MTDNQTHEMADNQPYKIPKNLPPPSLMVRKFLNFNAAEHEAKDMERLAAMSAPFEREYCFFYGTLMDPKTLSRVLNLPNRDPVMRRARVIGYQIKLWGSYPALVDGEPGQPVNGMMCEILSQAHMERLEAYETDKYRLQYCYIQVLNDDDSIEKIIDGVVFMWNGEKNELRPGTFDLKEKKLQNSNSKLNGRDEDIDPLGWRS